MGKFRILEKNFVTYTTTKCLPYYSLMEFNVKSFDVEDWRKDDKNIFLHLMENGFAKTKSKKVGGNSP